MPPAKGWKLEKARREAEALAASSVAAPGHQNRAPADLTAGSHVEPARQPPIALPQAGSDFAAATAERVRAPDEPLSRVRGGDTAVAPLALGPKLSRAGLVPMQPGVMARLTATIAELQKANRHGDAGQLEVLNLLLHEAAHKLPLAIRVADSAQAVELEDLLAIL